MGNGHVETTPRWNGACIAVSGMVSPRPSGARAQRRAAIVALAVVLMAGAPLMARGQASPTSPPTPGPEVRSSTSAFALDLAGREDLAPVELELERIPVPDAGLPPAGFGRMVLELGSPPDPVPGLDLGLLEHPPDWIVSGNRDQWPSPDPLVQRHLAAELDRIVSGQPWGRAPAAIMFNAVEIVEAVGRLVRGLRERRLPPGARVPTDGSVVLRAMESTGELPATVTVVPLTGDWVGETLLGSCAAGVCEVNGLPDAPSTLLVIGDGGAVVSHPGGRATLDVTLHPLGRLRLDPERTDVEVRIIVAETELVVPVVRWLNAGRGEWLELDGEGVLFLPEGDYVVEARGGRARTRQPVHVVGGSIEVVRVP